jgi:hypothetical protein
MRSARPLTSPSTLGDVVSSGAPPEGAEDEGLGPQEVTDRSKLASAAAEERVISGTSLKGVRKYLGIAAFWLGDAT